ncbi:hypothetical protein [Streptomyces canarius]
MRVHDLDPADLDTGGRDLPEHIAGDIGAPRPGVEVQADGAEVGEGVPLEGDAVAVADVDGAGRLDPLQAGGVEVRIVVADDTEAGLALDEPVVRTRGRPVE